jgi:hypothetical protein
MNAKMCSYCNVAPLEFKKGKEDPQEDWKMRAYAIAMVKPSFLPFN